MSDKREYNPIESLTDTQRILQDVEPGADSAFRLEDILAEYGGKTAPSGAADSAPAEEEDAGESGAVPEKPEHGNVVPFPGTPVPEEDPGDEDAASEPSGLRPDNDIDCISPEELFGFSGREEMDAGEPEKDEVSQEEPIAVSMEDIVASTVDAVKEEQERKRDRQRKKLEKARKKNAQKPVKRKEPSLGRPLPEEPEEPPLAETAAWHKRRYVQCRKSLLAALPVLAVLWLPWLLRRFGVAVPFFGDNPGNESLCVLVPQALLCILCWPVFHTALENLRERSCTLYVLTALSSVVTLLDELSLLFLVKRAGVSPLGGVAATAAVFALWGLTSYHRGMGETLRTAAMGEPACRVDCCGQGIAKGRGRRSGFYTRANMEDTASQWQRLLLPVIAAASAVLAVLASVGQGRGQDFLWCWSVILCAATSFVFPLAYFVPFGRLAVRLSRSGAAVAGQYGASALTSSRRIVVTDADLFPQGTVALNGLKLYGEERNRAISYAATLAVQGGGCLGRVFEDICRSDRIAYQPLEHFHIHDDNGLSGMIHGETVLVGPPIFMRHKAVRLPATLPSKTTVCLAVDGELTAVFAVKYNTSAPVESALRALGRNGLQLALAVRDGNITPKLLKTRFGTDGGAVDLEVSERLALSDPERAAEAPSGLLYREGLFPFVELVAGSRQLCHTVRVGNLLSLLGSLFGVLLGFYMTFTGSYGVLTPLMLLTYLLLWTAPMLPLLWGINRA